MKGNRDSELAIVVQDKSPSESLMAREPYGANRFAHNLRKRCFAGIFGFKNEEFVKDPLDPVMWEEIDKRVQV